MRMDRGARKTESNRARSTFHRTKAATIREIARRTPQEFGGRHPCDADLLTSFKGVGPKCANLALGIACGASRRRCSRSKRSYRFSIGSRSTGCSCYSAGTCAPVVCPNARRARCSSTAGKSASPNIGERRAFVRLSRRMRSAQPAPDMSLLARLLATAFAAGPLARHLGALLPRLRQSDRYRLLAALHLAAVSLLAPPQRALLAAAHGAFDALASTSTILPPTGFLSTTPARPLPRRHSSLPMQMIGCDRGSLRLRGFGRARVKRRSSGRGYDEGEAPFAAGCSSSSICGALRLA